MIPTDDEPPDAPLADDEHDEPDGPDEEESESEPELPLEFPSAEASR